MKKRFTAFGLVVAAALSASAGWNYDDSNSKDLRIYDDAGNWNFTVTKKTVGGVDQLTIKTRNSGAGSLDLTDFNVPGCTLVQFGAGSDVLTAAATGTLRLPASVKVIDRYAGSYSAISEIDAPGVEIVGMRSFEYNPNLETAYLPALTNVTGYGNHPSFTKLKTLTVSPDLEYIGTDSFQCPDLQSITPIDLPKLAYVGPRGLRAGGNVAASDAQWPTNFPALTAIDSMAFYGAPFTSFSAPNLSEIPDSAFRECKNMVWFSAPQATLTGSSQFYGSSSLEDIDINYDTITTVPANSFRATRIKAFRGINVTELGASCFYSCPVIESIVVSDDFTGLANANALQNVTTLKYFEPFLPKRLTTVSNAFYKNCALTNETAVYDFPSVPDVPASLCEKLVNLSHVIFRSDVTSIGKNAFKALCPNAVVDFYGTNVPALAQTALYYNGESDNQRVVVRVFNPEALANWQAAVAPNASVFATYLDKPDYPGDATIGLWSLASGVYAWVVYDEGGGEDESEGLVIRGVPAEIGTVIPAYGTRSGITVGGTVNCSAQASYTTASVRATLSGYVVSNVTDGVATFVASGSGNSYAYTQGTGRGELTWIWGDLQCHFTAEVSGFGSVNITDEWVDWGASVTLTATPDPYNVFVGWSGDIGSADPQSATITLTADQARAVTASFQVDEDVEMHWVYDDSDAQNPFLAYVTEDGQGMTWKFAVSGDANALTLVTRLSGAGELNLPEYVTEIGVNVFKGNNELTAVSGHGVLKVGKNSFNACPALTTIDFPNLTTVDPGAFRYDNGLVGDMVFSNLVNIVNDTSGNNFESAQFTSFCAPALTNIANAAFRGCSSMTNFVMSENCKRIGDTAFYGCAKLANIEPFLPKDMDAIGTIPFTQFKTLTCPLVWDQANIKEIGPNLFAYHQYEEINVLSPVTNLAAGAFGSIKAGTHINFYCDAPTMADKAIYQYLYNNRYAAERDQRIRIYVRKAGSLPSWKAAVAPYADVFESELKGKTPDYPGRRTMGVILVATDATYPAYAWVIDDATRGLMFLLH